MTNEEIKKNFLILPTSDFIPFLEETAIYNASTKPVACAAPATKGSYDVIRFNKENSQAMASSFKAIWRKYMRSNP